MNSSGWFEIRGRGNVAAIDNSMDQLPPSVELRDLLNQWVVIDGKKYYVVGVETQGYSRRNFALCIRGPR